VSQLNDDSYYDFDALVVLVDELDEAAELAAYDVVILGDAGFTSADWSGFEAELEIWVDGGGGLVVTGYGARQAVCDAAPTVASMLPVVCDDADVEGATLTVDDPTHPVSDEVLDFTMAAYIHSDTSPTLAVDGDGLMLASDGNWAVAVRDHGLGRVVYLAPVYMGKTTYGSAYLRSGEEDQLLEEAVAWAGGCIDADGDGGLDAGCGGDDCDDTDAAVYLGAAEVCNAIDDDCDGVVPDTEIDDDGDGLAECEGDCDDTDDTLNLDDLDGDGASSCDGDCDDLDPAMNLDDTDGDGWSLCDEDCDDDDPSRYPTAVEACNAIDDDCDGVVPDTEIDDDGDGLAECEGDCDDEDPAVSDDDLDADGYTPCNGDCDDGDATIHEGAEEIPYDGIDQDCDEADLTDVDGDGHDATDVGGFDCDDDDPGVHPDADEACDDGIDNDCDGAIDADDADCIASDDDDDDDDDSAEPGDDDDSWGGAGDPDGCACDSGTSARPYALLLPVLLLGWVRSRR
jgi:hypothetical protein